MTEEKGSMEEKQLVSETLAPPVVASLALSSWYADRVLVPILLMILLFAYGAWATLAGKSILGDPLREPARR